MEILPLRVYSGSLMTSLDSAGVHITILKLSESEKAIILNALDEKTDAPRWPGCSYSLPSNYYSIPARHERSTDAVAGPELSPDQTELLRACLLNACQDIIEKEEFINDLDSGCGDGDCGTTLKNLAEGIISLMDKLPLSRPASLFSELANIAEDRMGGTSGAIYSLMFTTAVGELSKADSTESWSKTWARAWRAGIDGIMKYSKARPGDKTMIDVLGPASTEFEKNLSLSYKEAAEKVAKCALEHCEKMKDIIPKAGRASYVKQKQYLQRMDAGAYAVAVWINAIARVL